jgi:hypothetical protein
MEISLITLGGILIIASFEIQFRYLAMAKQYHEESLNDVMEKIDNLFGKKKDIKPNLFLDELKELLSSFFAKRYSANFPNHLFAGFFIMGVYIILLGLLYETILGVYKIEPIITVFYIVIFATVISTPLIKGLRSFRELTKIV